MKSLPTVGEPEAVCVTRKSPASAAKRPESD